MRCPKTLTPRAQTHDSVSDNLIALLSFNIIMSFRGRGGRGGRGGGGKKKQ